mgnify:CR=1 FL=1
MIGGLLTWIATRPWMRAALRYGAIALTVLLFLLALRRSGERAGRLAERLDAEADGERASALELALEGLFLARRIGKEADDEGQTIYG